MMQADVNYWRRSGVVESFTNYFELPAHSLYGDIASPPHHG
jgi:hypothetical protein